MKGLLAEQAEMKRLREEWRSSTKAEKAELDRAKETLGAWSVKLDEKMKGLLTKQNELEKNREEWRNSTKAERTELDKAKEALESGRAKLDDQMKGVLTEQAGLERFKEEWRNSTKAKRTELDEAEEVLTAGRAELDEQMKGLLVDQTKMEKIGEEFKESIEAERAELERQKQDLLDSQASYTHAMLHLGLLEDIIVDCETNKSVKYARLEELLKQQDLGDLSAATNPVKDTAELLLDNRDLKRRADDSMETGPAAKKRKITAPEMAANETSMAIPKPAIEPSSAQPTVEMAASNIPSKTPVTTGHKSTTEVEDNTAIEHAVNTKSGSSLFNVNNWKRAATPFFTFIASILNNREDI
ncbi:hypothetical protein SBOR_4097 [Sclerotinia borealis F-4128]|uniref:Uncharacterized protein n=1 Tax=Sclerotinia borealis (strain F-4128) TaxID=1432307 RepID=W9CFI6_SCLBF|nr:hypothetical protein SBOR_4097 [Sclerotinia borealis F-4128]